MADSAHKPGNTGGSPVGGGDVPVMAAIDPDLLLEAAEFIHQMGWSPQDLTAAERDNRVFHMVAKGVSQYPAFCVRLDAAGRRQFATVCQLLGDLPGGSKWQFFTTGKGSLSGLTPLEALRKGKLPRVKDCARAFVER